MKKAYVVVFVLILAGLVGAINWAVSDDAQSKKERQKLVDTRVDNNTYWKKMAAQGLATLNPETKVEKAVFTGSKISARSVANLDSPDVAVTEENSTQSENSVFVNPNDFLNPLVSNNSTENPVGSLYGANDLYSFDGGEVWEGEVEGAGTSNSGDPTTAISNSGRYYVGYITNNLGQGVSYSDDQGENWTPVVVSGPGSASVLDKNHMWIDNSLSSPYEGNLYNAWGPLGGFGHVNENEIELSYSDDNGESWSSPVGISQAVNAGSHNQGINLSTGPDGEVYAVWSIYDSWPSDEVAIGFAKSLDGGLSWEPATRIIENTRGIRSTATSKNMRVNSFPSAAVDISGGQYNGTIYVVWSNIGVPGANTGDDIDVYMIKSSDEGESWSDPIRVNQDPPGQGKEHYFPWITCDPANGILSVVFYDDRNVSSSQCEVFCANSYDGGETWEDFKVSDVAFTPAPIAGLAGGYFGDYLGIAAYGGKVYPVWTDNRSGSAMTYTSPYETNPLAYPENLFGEITFENGQVDLSWEYEEEGEFEYFNIYRDNVVIGTATDTFYVDNLPDYGLYRFSVSAVYAGGDESIPASVELQWGDAHIAVTPDEINQVLKPGDSSMHYLTVYNIGELPLDFQLTPLIQRNKRDVEEYCTATTNYCDEYIARVQLGSIDNPSGCNNYEDNTDLYTEMNAGSTYELSVTNGSLQWASDQCAAWIDWNQDEVFDEDERITMDGSPGVGPYTADITPPSSAIGGFTRMRVRIDYNNEPQPCGDTDWGEVEDYGILVSNWLVIDTYAGNVTPGDSAVIGVQLNATDLDIGNYLAELRINNNDPDLPEVLVPVNLLVTEFEVTAGAEEDTICHGGMVHAHADTLHAVGDTVLYEWISIPEGHFSTERNPVFENVTLPTAFIVTATDQLGPVHDTLHVAVHDLPEVELGSDTTLCAHRSITLDAGANPDYTYLWFNGETGHSITIDTANIGIEVADAWVEVSNEFGCINRDTLTVTFEDCTGIQDLAAELGVSIFPNPADGRFTLQLASDEIMKVNLIILSQNGKIVYRENLSVSAKFQKEIDLGNNPSGIYTILLENNRGSISEKIIIN